MFPIWSVRGEVCSMKIFEKGSVSDLICEMWSIFRANMWEGKCFHSDLWGWKCFPPYNVRREVFPLSSVKWEVFSPLISERGSVFHLDLWDGNCFHSNLRESGKVGKCIHSDIYEMESVFYSDLQEEDCFRFWPVRGEDLFIFWYVRWEVFSTLISKRGNLELKSNMCDIYGMH